MEKAKTNRDLTNGEVKQQITKLLQERKDFLAKLKVQLKRTPYDSLNDKGMLNTNDIFNEYQLIREKKSKLSSGERSAIMAMMSIAIQRAILAQMKSKQKAQAEEEESSKPKKRTRKKSSKAL